MALPIPPDNTNPIPNDPFYSPETYLIRAAYNPFIVGSGLFVSQNGVISSSGGGGAVGAILAGAGISVNSNTGFVTVTNTGVLSLNAGSNVVLSNNTGAITISVPAAGTVTSITAGAGLIGGTITTSGTISLPDTGIVSGAYSNPTLSVDSKGRITAISTGTSLQSISGTAPISVTPGSTPVVSITAASTTTAGAVQLSDSVTSTSSTTAATSLAVKTAYDAIVNAVPKSCYNAAGTLVTATGASTLYSLAVGADGRVLTTCNACTGGMFWATPASGTLTSITAGTGLSGGTITSSGTISLNASCIIPPSIVTAKGDVITATSSGNPIALPVGTNGQVLTACSTAVTGLCWSSLPLSIPCACITALGDLITGSAPNTPATLNVGTDGQVLTACSAAPTGLCWSTVTPAIPCACIQSKGDILTGTAASTPTALGVGTDGQILVACSTATTGLAWRSATLPPAVPSYGSFYDTSLQLNQDVTNFNTVTLSNTAYSNNFSVVAGTRITAAVAGIYNLQISLQVRKTDAGTDNFEFWFAKNGVNINDSNTSIKTHSNDEAVIAALNFIEQLNAGDYLEIRWYSADPTMQLLAVPAAGVVPGVSPARPSIPSAIATIVPVGV